MNKVASPYYPPRARWYGAHLYRTYALRRCLHLEKIHPPTGFSWLNVILSFLIPGWVFSAEGQRMLGRFALASCGLLILLFLVWLGHPIANLMFGLLMSAHATSILHLLNRWMPEAGFRRRLWLSLAVSGAVGGCIYFPSRNAMQEHLLLPLNVNGRVIVVQKLALTRSVTRGDWIAYHLGARDESALDVGIWIHAGYGLRPVLAKPGDRVRFRPGQFEMNGVAYPALPHMPKSGELVVPEKHWFVWPEFAISGHGAISEADLSSVILKMALVSEKQFIGKPFKRWFWRRQILT